jgi:hypothetical protein
MNEKTYQKAIEARKRAFERHKAKSTLKQKKSLQTALKRVYDEVRQDTFHPKLKNCFRCYSPPAESEAHIRAKFERYLDWIKVGAIVFTELIWKNNSRSDLVICLNNGEVQIEEIVESEKEESLLLKEDKYPFPFKVIRPRGKNGI